MKLLIDIQKTIIEQLKEGEFVKGMEDCYAGDAVNEGASGDRVVDKAKRIKFYYDPAMF